MRPRPFFLAALLVSFGCAFARAAERPSASSDKEGEKTRTFEQKAIDAAKSVGHGFDWMANKLDLYLAGKRYTRVKNDTSVNIRQTFRYEEGGLLRPSTDFGLNLRLPNVEKRWALRFASYDEEAEQRDLTERRAQTRPRPQEYSAGFVFFQKLGDISTSFQPQLQLKDPLEMKYTLRFESEAKNDRVRLVPKFQLFADPNRGTGEYFSAEVVVALDEFTDLSIENSEEYQGGQTLWRTQHGVAVDHELSDTRGIGASVSASSSTLNAYHLEGFTLAVTYGETLSKDLLRWRVTPYWAFSKGYAFKGRNGVTLSVELIL